jgi:prepilin-type processing-associated H-X9-DG protein
VHVSSGAGLDIVWADGHVSHYEFAFLREECPCATCDDLRRKKESAKVQGSAAGSAVLPMYKPKAGARGAKPLGNYALQIEFTDGHSTGIYSYEHLRALCPCEECAREFRS